MTRWIYFSVLLMAVVALARGPRVIVEAVLAPRASEDTIQLVDAGNLRMESLASSQWVSMERSTTTSGRAPASQENGR